MAIRFEFRALFAALFAFALALAVRAQSVERVSVSAAGGDSNGWSFGPSMSPDGRYVAFASRATNLVASDTNGTAIDVFLRDRTTQTTLLVSVDPSGAQSPSDCGLRVAVSFDGRYVAFSGNGLHPSDADPESDIYLRDRTSATTSLVPGAALDYGTPSISDDGRIVASVASQWWSGGVLLAVHDFQTGQAWSWPGHADPSGGDYYDAPRVSRDGLQVVFAHTTYWNTPSYNFEEIWRLDTTTGQTQMLASGEFARPLAISGNARYVLFDSRGPLRRLDTQTGTTETLLIATGNSPSGALADDPRYAAFVSYDSTLVPGDSNGVRDAFLHDRAGAHELRVSLDAAGAQSNGASDDVALSADASVVAFASSASNLVFGDANGVADVFVRTNCFLHHADQDGDGFGAAGPGQLACIPVAAGLVSNGLDCDDSNPGVNPGVAEVCNGIDDDCNGLTDDVSSGAEYCYVSITSQGCAPQVSGSGIPSASATSGFVLQAAYVEPQRNGMIFYGLTPTSLPWAPGSSSTLCVASPRQRTTAMNSGGTAAICTGQLSLDFLAWTAAHPGALGTPLGAGQALYFQAWFRDPPAPGGTNLSNGWSVTLCP